MRIIAWLIISCISYPAEKLFIVAGGQDHIMYYVSKKILTEAYKQIGYDIDIQSYPMQRAKSMLDKSRADGYNFAGTDIISEHPTCVPIKIPIGYDDIVVYSVKTYFKVSGWESLKPYSIGYMKGIEVIENNIRGMNTDRAITPTQAFDKLIAGRTDIVVLPRAIGLMIGKKYPAIRQLEPPVKRIPLYTVLSSMRADIAPKLENVLSGMIDSGRIRIITDEVEAEILKKK
jgi:polar amino acid transport system substrate-binding protein